jgi:hypothetical protein
VPVGRDRPAGDHAVGDVGYLLGEIPIHDAPPSKSFRRW